MLAAPLGGFECGLGDAAHFAAGINLGVKSLLVLALAGTAFGRAEVNAARKFAHDDHVKASSRDVCAQGRKTVESREDACRTQVAKELVALAQRQQRPRFRALLVREMIPLRAADAAKENGLSSVTGCNCFFRQRRAAGINGGAAHEFFRTFNGKAEFACGGIKYAECLAHNFGADAVAGQNCNAMVAGHILQVLCTAAVDCLGRQFRSAAAVSIYESDRSFGKRAIGVRFYSRKPETCGS